MSAEALKKVSGVGIGVTIFSLYAIAWPMFMVTITVVATGIGTVVYIGYYVNKWSSKKTTKNFMGSREQQTWDVRQGFAHAALDKKHLENDRIKAEIDALKVKSLVQVLDPDQAAIVFNPNTGMPTLINGKVQVSQQVTPVNNELTTDVDTPDPLPNLLSVIHGLDRILIIGGMDAGKSELLRHLVHRQSQGGHVIVCDPHSAPGDWPNTVQVVGMGRQYDMIESTVQFYCDELDKRYESLSQGLKVFNYTTLVIDELFVLNQFMDLSEYFKLLLAETRKVSMGIICAGQSDRAGAIGLSGNLDLIAGYQAIVRLKKLPDGSRVASVEIGDEVIMCRHPGVFENDASRKSSNRSNPKQSTSKPHKQAHTGVKKPRPTYTTPRQTTIPRHMIGNDSHGEWACAAGPTQDDFYESNYDKSVCDGFKAGKSISSLAERHQKYSNGRTIKKIKQVLINHNLL